MTCFVSPFFVSICFDRLDMHYIAGRILYIVSALDIDLEISTVAVWLWLSMSLLIVNRY